MFRRGPLAFADDRQSHAVDDEVKAFTGRNSPQCDVEKLTAPGDHRGDPGRVVNAHHPKRGCKNPRPDRVQVEGTETASRLRSHAVVILPLRDVRTPPLFSLAHPTFDR
jgi:hypothetical protein